MRQVAPVGEFPTDPMEVFRKCECGQGCAVVVGSLQTEEWFIECRGCLAFTWVPSGFVIVVFERWTQFSGK